MTLLRFTLLILLVAGLLAIRFWPISPQRWHVDPFTAAGPGQAGVRAYPDSTRLPTPELSAPPAQVMAQLDGLIRASGNVRPIAGSLDDAHVTYLLRSRWMGFPDLITLRVQQAGTATRVAIMSRSAYGGYDWGVNQKRVSAWLDALTAQP